ncbi:YihY family inner membrane protein [Microbulbifer sp. YPW16]|uniref:YihY family inner membrane protein n=1 Tax=unclassified Microbulbifer TaxID=2619833 RepID=UPI001E5536E7|nr:YihY family inner membrane protein [Microbulbifer sp. YPW16]UHQ55036.1 YihY family inner membrane protein [Microbulbifer sp. YPW16]
MTEQVHRWRRFLVSLWTLFNEKNCRQNAAALTYMTLFAIVPLVTVSYAMLSLFPDFAGLENRLQQQIFEHLVPASGREVQEYISSFSAQAQRLTGPGVAILMVTAGLMLRNIEATFNAIWDIPRGRSGVSSFLLYWAILSLGPILLGAGLVMSTYLISQKLFLPEEGTLGLVPMVLRLLPFLFTTIAFTLLFTAVPNCRVPLRHGIAGGVITAFAFELAKVLFGIMVARSSVQAIYGAFAFVPLFLMWIFLLWMIVLAGCVLVRMLSAYDAAAQGRKYSDVMATLVLLWEAFRKYQHGLPLRDQDISRAGIKPAQWRRIREVLQRHKVFTQNDRNDFVLQRDLDSISLMQLAGWMNPAPLTSASHAALQDQPWFGEVEKRFSAVREFTGEQLAMSVAELFRGTSGDSDADKSGGAGGSRGKSGGTTTRNRKTRSKRGSDKSATESSKSAAGKAGKTGKEEAGSSEAMGSLSFFGRRNKRV